MKKTLIYIISLILVIGCFSPSQSNKELFKETDSFVESLQTTYQSYGLLGGSEHKKTTSDGLYSVSPVGRLINVKILKVATNEEYEELRKDLEEHYKDNSRVNKVYICGAGTVMIDCRN